ncbi:MAG: hypothetical protein L0K86_18255 [Actinomycetia bacterium]|nr:hypothetical protein [Actinomycetes bacterium]
MDSHSLKEAFQALLDTAADAASALPPSTAEWSFAEVLAHVSLVTAATIGTVAAVSSGIPATYDNLAAQDAGTLQRVISRIGSPVEMRERIRQQADALCLLVSSVGSPELDTAVPTLLVSHGTTLVEQPLALRDIIGGLVEVELPGHTQQLRALLPRPANA